MNVKVLTMGGFLCNNFTFNYIIMREDLELYLDTIDTSSSEDYIYEDYMNEYAEWLTGQIWNNLKNKVYDQFDQKSTYKACSCYGLGVIYNGNNLAEYSSKGFHFEQEDPKYSWQDFQSGRWIPNKGASLQQMLSFYKKRNKIEWYMRADTLEWCKNALANWFLIYTGTKSCDWRKAWAEWRFVYKRDWGGHCFALIGYDKEWFIAVNSFWTDWGDSWYFVIPYKDFEYLFSKYVIIDKDDTGILANLEYDREFKKAIELGITNWSDPDWKSNRKQVAVMVYRLYKRLINEEES